MTHLNEEQLIEHYYGEATNNGVKQHLRLCRECKDAYEALINDLSELKKMPPPERDPRYGTSVWEAIEHKLPSYRHDPIHWRIFAPRALALAALAAALIVAAFMLGRAWQPTHPPALVANDSNAHKRLMSVLLDEHFEHAERFLTELRHADARNSNQLQREARDLLAENRLYRAGVARLGVEEDTHALQRLERLLVEVANEPDGLTEDDLHRISTRFKSDDLLFELRILTSRPANLRATDTGNTGSTI